MSSVTFSTSVGGDNSTVTDDASASTGLANGGHRSRFVPALAQVVAVAGHVVTKAGEANDDAIAAAASALAADNSADAAWLSAAAAAASEAAAATIAAGVTATSTTSLTIALVSQSLTVQADKQFEPGQRVIVVDATSPANYMWGPVTSYNAGTGALVFTAEVKEGSGTLASWIVSIAGARGARGETGTGVTDQVTGWTASGGTTPKTLTVDEDVAISAIKAGAYPCVVSYSARAANTQLVAADKGKFIDITSGTFTQTLASAATLGAGWWCYLRNSGTGDITLDPSGTEDIDGLGSYIMYPSECRMIICDGVRLRSVVLCGYYKTFPSSGTFITPPGYKAHEGLLWGGGGGGSCVTSTYIAGAGGGACTRFIYSALALGTYVNFSIGSGGAAVTGMNLGGNSGSGSAFATAVAYGGGGASASGMGGSGGGALGSGLSTGSGSYVTGGAPSNTASSTNIHNDGFGGGAATNDYTTNLYGGSSVWGGGGGGPNGGGSVWGGGGGGGSKPTTQGGAGGSSVYGGAGGSGVYGAGTAASGVIPGGAGGSVSSGSGSSSSGAGARGELRIWGVL